MNRFNGIGRITKELVLKKTNSGVSVVSFNLAIDRMFKKDGEQNADFIPVQAWDKKADNLCKYCGKGSKIGIEGHIQTRNYDGNDGKKVYITEVVADSIEFLDKTSSQAQEHPVAEETPINDGVTNDGAGYEISSDDLPF